MKKIKEKWLLRSLMLLFAVVMMGAAFTACSDDDDTGGGSSEEAVEAIVGEWQGYVNPNWSLVHMTARFYSDGTAQIWWRESNSEFSPIYYYDGDYTITKKKVVFSGKWNVNGEPMSTAWDFDESNPYTLKDGTLSLTFRNRNWVLTKR